MITYNNASYFSITIISIGRNLLFEADLKRITKENVVCGLK